MKSTTYIGIDVSKDHLDVAYLDKERNWHEERLANELDSLLNWLAQWKDNEVCLVFEYTGDLLHLAEEVGVPHHIVNPTILSGHTHRNDQQSARSLARMGVQQGEALSHFEKTKATQTSSNGEALLGQRQALKKGFMPWLISINQMRRQKRPWGSP